MSRPLTQMQRQEMTSKNTCKCCKYVNNSIVEDPCFTGMNTIWPTEGCPQWKPQSWIEKGKSKVVDAIIEIGNYLSR